MDEAEKRRLKKLGKKLVEQQSRELQERLHEANPAPVGSDEWVKGYRAGVERERQFRRHRRTESPPRRHGASLSSSARSQIFGVPTWYHECPVCGDLLHSVPQQTVACSCGNLLVDIDALQVASCSIEQVRLVKFIGRGEPGAALGRDSM